MKLHWLYALSLVALLGCGADPNTDPAIPDGEEIRTPAWMDIVGSYTRASGDSHVVAVVFESTPERYGHHYFLERQVECFRAPCPPVREEGFYTVSAHWIALHPTGGSYVLYRYYRHSDGTLDLYGRNTGATDFSLTKVTSYCDTPSDCDAESLIHPLCWTTRAQPWSCEDDHTCRWHCGADEPPPPPVCTTACTRDRTNCPGACCTDLQSDTNNCGACGHACAAGESCNAGACTAGCFRDAECPSGQICNNHVCGAAECTTGSDCVRSGCSGEVCAPEPTITTCIWRDSYTCLRYEACGCNAGRCGFTPTDNTAFDACVAVHGRP